MCAFDEATPSFVTLVREMDGQVPAPTLCVDSTGRVHAAALPSEVGLRGHVLEGQRLATLLVDSDANLPAVRADLDVHGRRRARIRLSHLYVLDDPHAPESLEADLVRIDRPQDDSPLESKTERRIADLTRSVESVAHDLKGPLASALGFAGLLESQCSDDLDEAGQTYLSNLRKNVHRVQALLEGLIEYTRARDCELRRSYVEPLPMVEQIRSELKADLDERGIELTLPEKLDPIWADPRRMQQVAINLIMNAAHHMGRAASPRIRVEVARKSYGRFFIVSDNGQGIPEDTRAQILELFRSGGQLQGSGLGLSIVRRVMESHGGFVEIESEPGQGSTFRAFFPDPQ